MIKKVVSILVAFMVLLSATAGFAQEGTKDITVYLSLSRYGEIVKDKNEVDMAYTSVQLSGKSEYTLDDVFLTAHKNYYENGEEGYASSVGEWGFGVDKLWGDTSYNFGYQINGGIDSVMGLGHIVNDGDYIDAFIYKNLYPDTESYAKFDSSSKKVFEGEELKLTLYSVTGYDDNWQNIFSPCAGATISINGEQTEYVTNENGEVFISFDVSGEYIISASKEKTIKEEVRPAIVAPVCLVSVEDPAIELIHNIAKKYSQIDPEEAGGNLPWIVADMMVYEELYPESENLFSEEKKDEIFEKIVSVASKGTKAGDLAKYSLALRAMGYDAEKLYTEDFKKDDIIAKLVTFVDNQEESVTNIYTLPYVMIALSQAENYATHEQIEYLINSAIESKIDWQNTEFGTDALTPMMLALAPYYNTNEEVKAIIDETVAILIEKQRDDGLIEGFEGYEPASTGLAICAISAVGINPDNVMKAEASLIDGLISSATQDLDGFPNAFATEQGFRGLLAWRLFEEGSDKLMYDFKDKAMDEANVPGNVFCPVIFDVTPGNATVIADGVEEISNHCYDLDEGTYTFTISASMYYSQTYTVEVTAEDVLNREPKKVTITLAGKSSGGSGSGGGGDTGTKEETVDNNKNDEEEKIPESESKPDPEKIIFNEDTFSDVKSESWYFSAVKYVYENDLFKGTGKGFEPDSPMTRGMLVTVLHRLDNSPYITADNTFSYVESNAWYAESVKWASKNGIINGITDAEFAPDVNITREQVATILFRYASYKGYDLSTKLKGESYQFKDFENISDYAMDAVKCMLSEGVLQGKESGIIAPTDDTTRAEVATMLMRFIEVEKERL